VEAVDDLTLKYYYTVIPGLPVWQYGALLGPVVNKAYWEPRIADLLAQAEALDPTAADYYDLITPLQQELEAITTEGEPTFGGIKFGRWEPGAYAENVFNDQFALLGSVEEQYANGAYREYNQALGYDYTLYGEASGDKTLEVTFGPYFDTFLFPVYSQDAAYLALQSGPAACPRAYASNWKGIRTSASFKMLRTVSAISSSTRRDPISPASKAWRCGRLSPAWSTTTCWRKTYCRTK